MSDAAKTLYGDRTKRKVTFMTMATLLEYVFPPVLNMTKPF